ncbi:MAG: glycosyltransferase [Flavobacteriales bacterium]|nr:glycosyltransferase [Flavobacteriales bacterium]
METSTPNTGQTDRAPHPPHVLILPKWWPNPDDPQLGDFLRKQAIAVAQRTRATVLYVRGDKSPGSDWRTSVSEERGLWELHIHYPASDNPFTPWRKVLNFIRFRRAVVQGWRRIVNERGRPELTHAHIMVRPALVAFWLKQRFGIPFLVSEQSSEYLDGTFARKGRVHKGLVRFLMHRAGAISAVSAWLGDALVRFRLCEHYAVVPNVVPGLDRPLPPAGHPGNFLIVADLVDRTKNVSGALRALERARRVDPRIRLTVIGDGPDRRSLEELVQELSLEEHVKFLGRLPNSGVLDHLGSEAAVIVNSNVETFSVVTGEALAQGKPVIATRCGGPIAFINDGNGILIEVGDETALSQAMVELSTNAAHYSPAAIRESVSSRFSPEAVGHAFVELYYRVIADHHGK